jgi:hypothetical protein
MKVHKLYQLTFPLFCALLAYVWPGEGGILSSLSILGISILTISLLPRNLINLLIVNFYVTAIVAFYLYYILAPDNLFLISKQDPEYGVTDSQYYYYLAREFIDGFNPNFIVGTWGSAAPVLYGSIVLSLFFKNFLGIVFVNVLIFTLSIGLILNSFPIRKYKGLWIIALLPICVLYNSMLSKEPIYLFLCTLSLHYGLKIAIHGKIANYFPFMLTSIALVLFRPVGTVAVLLSLVSYLILTKKTQALKVFFILFTTTITLSVLFSLIFDYKIPLFISDAGGGLEYQVSLASEAAYSKGVSFIAPLVTWPFSFIFSPLLAIYWLVSPLPFIGDFVSTIYRVFESDAFKFQDIALIFRVLESTLILVLLIKVLMLFDKKIFLNKFVFFAIYHTIFVVTFQFLESGRHRYLPDLIIVILYIVLARGKGTQKVKHI